MTNRRRAVLIVLLTTAVASAFLAWFAFIRWTPHQAGRAISGLSIPGSSDVVHFVDRGWGDAFSISPGITLKFKLTAKALAQAEKEADANGFKRLPQPAGQDPTLPAVYLEPTAQGWYFIERKPRSADSPKSYTLVILDSRASTLFIESLLN